MGNGAERGCVKPLPFRGFNLRKCPCRLMRAFFMSYKKSESITQGSLFPVSLDELIPADHSVRVIAVYVDHLVLAKLGFAKSVTKATGRPP